MKRKPPTLLQFLGEPEDPTWLGALLIVGSAAVLAAMVVYVALGMLSQ